MVRAIGIGFANVSSFDAKAAPGISRKPFDTESHNFTGTSIPTLSTAIPDITSLSTSGRKLWGKQSKIPPPMASGGVSPEQFKLE